ncbi:MAG TPA: hypothetical protein PLI19_00675 [Erysipelotrichaceae bacterium]|nr:hypothetical protein [Erysipelotrichaceae bacterium]
MTDIEILLISASPRKKGTSVMLLERIKKVLGGELVFLSQKGSLDELIDKMSMAKTIVISGPTYINSYPARLYELLEKAAASIRFSGQKLYGIINGGMPYVHTHQHGLDYLKLFAEANNLLWMGGFVLGGGAILDGQPLERHLNHRKVIPLFDKFIHYIEKGALIEEDLSGQGELAMPKFITCILSKVLSYKVKKHLKEYGHSPDATVYYLKDAD